MDFISEKKLGKYIKDHKFSINHDTLKYITNNLNKKSSKLFSNLNKKEGGTSLPGEFFGINTGAYSETLSTSPTEMSTSNALSVSTRTALQSNTFPLLNGGCGCSMVGGSNCKICYEKNASCAHGSPGLFHNGGGKVCKEHNSQNCYCKQNGNCIVCIDFFTQKNIKDISSLLNLKLKKKNYKSFNKCLSNDLKKIMHLIFNEVKNKDKLIGKSHFTKAIKKFQRN
jgi:hypothetical protein